MRKKELVITAAGSLLGFFFGFICGKNAKSSKESTKSVPDKFAGYFTLFDQWLCLKEEGKGLEPYFIAHGYKRIAIYGIGKASDHLVIELEDSKIEIVYGIDKRAGIIYADMPLFGLEDEWPEVDVIVITPVYDYDNIARFLKEKVNCPVVSLSDVVHG